MGCATSKILTRSASLKEEFQKRLQRGKTDSYEEILIAKNVTDKFVAALCSSNKVATNQPSIPTKEDSKEPDNNIETINTWELLAGLEDDNAVEVQKKEPSKSFNILIKDDSETCKVSDVVEEGGGEKGLRRKVIAKELAKVTVPTFEFSRTGSLRDWLSQGGQVLSPGSYVTPRFGSFETEAANGGVGNEEEVFDPKLVAQLEEAMEEMTMEEEKILRQIV